MGTDTPAADTTFDPTANTVAEAFDAYRAAHSSGCPIAHSDRHGGFWLVVGEQEARTVLADPDRFRSGDGVLFPDPQLPRIVPIEFDEPEHRALRAIFTDALTPPKVRATGERIKRRIDTLIDRFIADGHTDFKAEFAGPLTLQTIADHIGVPHDRIDEMETVSRRLLEFVDNPSAENANAVIEFSSFAMELIEDRRTSPRDDVLTLLATAEVDGHLLEAEQLFAYCGGFFIAGHDTTRSSLCRLLYLIGRDEALKQTLIEDPDMVGRAVEESLRLRPPFHFFRRTVATETELSGAHLMAGDAVLVSFAGANRDPAAFSAPDDFRLDRPETRHLAFGAGIHFCSGANLARTQIRLAVTRILQRLPDFRPTTIDSDDATQLKAVDSMDALPVEFSAGVPGDYEPW